MDIATGMENSMNSTL